MVGKGDDKYRAERLKRNSSGADQGAGRGRGGRGRGGRGRGGRGRGGNSGGGRGGRRRSGSRDGRSNGAWERDGGGKQQQQGGGRLPRRDSSQSNGIFRQQGSGGYKHHDTGRSVRQVTVSALGNQIPATNAASGPVRVSALGNVITASTDGSASKQPVSVTSTAIHANNSGHNKRHGNPSGGSRNSNNTTHKHESEDPPEELPSLDSLDGLGQLGGGWGDRMAVPKNAGEPDTSDTSTAEQQPEHAMVTALRTEISMLKNEIKNNQTRVDTAESEAKAAKAAQADVEKVVLKQQEEIKIMNNVNSSFGKIRSKLESEREEFRKTANRNETKVRELQHELDTLKDGGALAGGSTDAKVQQLEQKVAEYSALVDKLQRDLSASQIKSQTLEIDLEFIQAKQNYDQIRADNLNADLAECNNVIDKLKAENESLQAQLTVARGSSDTLTRPVDNAKSSPVSTVAAAVAESPQATNLPSNAESHDALDDSLEPDQDDDNSEDEPWLFSATEEDTTLMLQELDFTEQQTCSLDVLKWGTLDSFVDDLSGVFETAGLNEVVGKAKSLKSYSPEFWQLICTNLSEVCNEDLFLIVRGLESLTSDKAESAEILNTFRCLVSCISEAYEEAENPQRLLMVLPNFQQPTVGGEDPTGNSVSPSLHQVVTYRGWKVAAAAAAAATSTAHDNSGTA